MKLDETQKTTVATWIADGLKLADIQKRLGVEFGLTFTYMEVRMLVDDLKLMPKDPPKAERPVVAPEATANPLGANAPIDDAGVAGRGPLSGGVPAGAGKVAVKVDMVARPGALVSGGVVFSDGKSATWHLDQMGRLAIGPQEPGYKPSAADLQSFQQTLEVELSKIGL